VLSHLLRRHVILVAVDVFRTRQDGRNQSKQTTWGSIWTAKKGHEKLLANHGGCLPGPQVRGPSKPGENQSINSY
jgi:hypothetical protein